jgi:hypothetical protein
MNGTYSVRGGLRNACKILVWRRNLKKPLWRPVHIYENNVVMGLEGTGLIGLALDSVANFWEQGDELAVSI